jgi:hypothetical protein
MDFLKKDRKKCGMLLHWAPSLGIIAKNEFSTEQ